MLSRYVGKSAGKQASRADGHKLSAAAAAKDGVGHREKEKKRGSSVPGRKRLPALSLSCRHDGESLRHGGNGQWVSRVRMDSSPPMYVVP